MSESDIKTLGQALFYEDSLPLRWREADDQVIAFERPILRENNEELLRLIAVLDDHPAENGDETDSHSQDFVRVETKLNLLLGLVGQLVAVHFPLPSSRPVRLNPLGVEWTNAEALRPGDSGMVEIYLSTCCPRPLVLPGKVNQVEPATAGYRVSICFTEIDEATRERLEKLIFRHHRRSVAIARRRAAS